MLKPMRQMRHRSTLKPNRLSRPSTPKNKQPRAPRTRDGSKQAQLIAMLRRAKGATIDEIVEALEWQPHTVRGAIAGALKKKLGLNVTSEKDEKRGHVYRIVAHAAVNVMIHLASLPESRDTLGNLSTGQSPQPPEIVR